jgi:hypothetical protein
MVPGEAPFVDRLAAATSLLSRAGEQRRRPVHVVDQAEAAARDARALLHQLGSVEAMIAPGRFHDCGDLDDPGLHRQARIVAAVTACRPCWHLRNGGPQPAVVSLPTRRADCVRCAPTWRRPVVADDRCDICGELAPDNTFWPVRAQLGVLVVVGDMCHVCAAVIAPEEAA